MSTRSTHKWTFAARFRAGAYGWKSSRLACQRVREAVSEIKKVARKEPDLGAEGAVRLIEKLWPALEHVNTSSGALGSAVNKALDQLLPVIINAPADDTTRQKWLERLWQAKEEDGVDYLAPVGDHWGEICGSVEVANFWAEELVPTLRLCWSNPNQPSYFRGTTACLSCLLVAGRNEELLDLLALQSLTLWHYRRFGVEALLAMGKKGEALRYAEASRGLNEPNPMIDRACEKILNSSGFHDEAYRRYGLRSALGITYLARFRDVAKRYPMKEASEILTDLIASTPGEEGKWFATAKELKLYELALDLAKRSPCDPKTLSRAARDHIDSAPGFALGSALIALHWLSNGWGYEVTDIDVNEVYDRAMDVAIRLNRENVVTEYVRKIVETNDRETEQFVRQILRNRMSEDANEDNRLVPPE